MALLDDFLVDHDLAGPLDGSDADEQHGEAQGDTQADVLGIRIEVTEADERVVEARPEIDDHEGQRKQGSEAEAEQDLRGGPELGTGVDIGITVDVGLDARIVHRMFDNDAVGIRLRADVEVLPGGLVVIDAHLARAPFEAIHTANRMRVPRPPIQTQKPSSTGPRPPKPQPPWLGSSWSWFR